MPENAEDEVEIQLMRLAQHLRGETKEKIAKHVRLSMKHLERIIREKRNAP